MTMLPDESLDWAERWLRDGLQVLRPALSVIQVTVDMTNALARLEALRRSGVQADDHTPARARGGESAGS